MNRAGLFALVFVFASVLFVDVGWTEDVSVEATITPDVVPVGSEATLVINVKGKFRKTAHPELPAMDEFSVYSSGSSQSFRIVNGQRSSSLQFTYVIVPKKEGFYTIGPIRFRVGDKEYTANPVKVEVVSAASQLAPPGGDENTVDDEAAGKPIFIQARVGADTVFVNQQVTWTLAFYTDGRVDLLRSPEYSPPTAEGFWVEDLPPQKNYYKTVNGRKYLVNEIRRGFFPTTPGEYTIGSARVDLVLDDFGGRRSDDFFSRNLR